MRKLIGILSVMIAAVSCFSGNEYSESYIEYATFEYGTNYLEEFGADSLYFETKYGVGLGWGYMAFYHKVDLNAAEFRGGFMLSYLAVPSSGEVSELLNNEYRVNAKGPSNIRNTYLVFTQTDDMPEHDMSFHLDSNNGLKGVCTMQSCYVNNTVSISRTVEEKFVQGDRMTLKAKGYLAGKPTGEAEIVLAERTTAKDSIMSAWTLFDLSKLGAIDDVDFEIESPRDLGIPLAFCIDDVKANILITLE